VDERVVITDDSQESAHVESEVAALTKSAASSGKDTESEASESVRSPPSVVSPGTKGKGMRLRTPAPPSLLSLPPKNRLPKMMVTSTRTTT
jgi:hypothetical protein